MELVESGEDREAEGRVRLPGAGGGGAVLVHAVEYDGYPDAAPTRSLGKEEETWTQVTVGCVVAVSARTPSPEPAMPPGP